MFNTDSKNDLYGLYEEVLPLADMERLQGMLTKRPFRFTGEILQMSDDRHAMSIHGKETKVKETMSNLARQIEGLLSDKL